MTAYFGFPPQPTPKDFGLAEQNDWETPENKIKYNAYKEALHKWEYAIKGIAEAIKRDG